MVTVLDIEIVSQIVRGWRHGKRAAAMDGELGLKPGQAKSVLDAMGLIDRHDRQILRMREAAAVAKCPTPKKEGKKGKPRVTHRVVDLDAVED